MFPLGIKIDLALQDRLLKSAVNTWEVGQVLTAIVKGRQNNTTVELQIGKNTILARSSAPMRTGDRIRLELVNNDSDLVFRRLIPARKSPGIQAKEQLLREHLPRNQSMLSAFSRLQAIHKTLASRPQPEVMPTPLKRQLAELQATLPAMRDLATASKLKKVIQESGVFLESRLRENLKQPSTAALEKPSTPVKQDLKAVLLKTTATVEQQIAKIRDDGFINLRAEKVSIPVQSQDKNVLQGSLPDKTPPEAIDELLELRTVLEAAVSRIKINQSFALASQETQVPPWLLELPVRNSKGELLAQLSLEYDHQQAGHESTSARHSIKLSLELEKLGTIHAEISLSNSQVYSSIWSDDRYTQELISQNIGELEQRMKDAGLSVGVVSHAQTGSTVGSRKDLNIPVLRAKV